MDRMRSMFGQLSRTARQSSADPCWPYRQGCAHKSKCPESAAKLSVVAFAGEIRIEAGQCRLRVDLPRIAVQKVTAIALRARSVPYWPINNSHVSTHIRIQTLRRRSCSLDTNRPESALCMKCNPTPVALTNERP